MKPHLIWDWNGTLLDDRTLFVESLLGLLAEEGVVDLTPETVTARFATPLQACVENLLRRPVPPDRWPSMDARFHARYNAGRARAPLVRSARTALDRGRRLAAGQSLVSHWPHTEVVQAVAYHHLEDLFDEVRGSRSAEAPKSVELTALMTERHLSPDETVLIGDSVNDIDSAREVGIRMVLVQEASLAPIDEIHRGSAGVTVASSAADAVEIACAVVDHHGRARGL
ncbi:HAD family hydrolase [Amycolatopsis sp. cmx-4-61]|uniref:HAD family hydrolase n=1 Tax=Amycolatopsis sp. cmx-4-61 TaxID=2790937 RepID=UPI00397D4DAB